MRTRDRVGARRFRAMRGVYNMPSRPRRFHQPREWDSGYHAPALVAPVVELLGAALLDAGVGRVIGIDRDPDALTAARARLAGEAAAGRFAAYHGNYASLEAIAPLDGLRFTGILLDLGISSHQIDDASRGFSFREGAPLDMRMGGTRDDARTAAELLNESPEMELGQIFREYGDEPRA